MNMKQNDSSDLQHSDIVSSSLYRRFITAFALMAIVPLLVFGYFVTIYIIPTFQTIENLPLVTFFTVMSALVGFFMMRKVLLTFLRLKKYTLDIAKEKLITIHERPEDSELNEMVTSLNSIIGRLLNNQEELKRQNEILQQRYEEIQRLGTIKEGLVRMIAHDVNNFIVIIGAAMELLASGEFDADTQLKMKYHSNLQFSIDSLRHMIDNMLNIEGIESGEGSFSFEVLDLDQLSSECLRPLKLRFENNRKRLVHLTKSAPKPVNADRDLISRVIWNLLWNAEQHTSDGGLVSLSVGTESDGRSVFLRVSDDGDGIPESIRGKIFDKFFQGKGDRGRKGTTGLGLAFCDLAVKMHGGSIDVESEEGQGSTFTIHLPVAQPNGANTST